MLRTPDIPTRENKEFDPEEFEKEKLWLKRKEEGKILSSKTDGGWVLVLSTSFIISLVLGGPIGTLLAFFFREFIFLFTPPFIVFLISLYVLSGDFATVEIDPERELLRYDGAINFGGEYRSVNYRGPIEVVEGIQLIKFKKIYYQKAPFIRFITRSGYMRVNYNPEKEEHFLRALESVGLIDLRELQKAVEEKKVVKETREYKAYLVKKYDRSDFYKKLKKEREKEEKEKEIQRRIKRSQAMKNSSETEELNE